MPQIVPLLVIFVLAVAPGLPRAESDLGENRTQVQLLNEFADELLGIVDLLRAEDRVITKKRVGSYAGYPEFYTEVDYIYPQSGLLAARVRWVNEAETDLAQTIEFFLYDKKGGLVADYFVSYLVGHRNAPMYALINLHGGDGDLQAFRQFDIFGERTYEHCKGTYFGNNVDVAIDPFDGSLSADRISEELYTSCFGYLPLLPEKFTHPAAYVRGAEKLLKQGEERDAYEELETRLKELDQAIQKQPSNARFYAARGDVNFHLLRMTEAERDFSEALRLDDTLDAAYFGRGLARGRLGDLKEGISDLSVFIERNPDDSMAYTKRGVRHLWNKDFESAIKDLKVAVGLDDHNAEAHDDLGVALAQTGEIIGAIDHFEKARLIDPSYQKAHHNLAMVLYMTGDMEGSLSAVDRSLHLAPNAKDSVMLKSLIFERMGRDEDAARLRERAEFLPDGNWSERSAFEQLRLQAL